MRPVHLLLIAFLWLGVAQCRSDKAPADPNKPEYFLYAVRVGDLPLRKKAEQDATIVAHLTEGELMEGQGEYSPNKEELTLRGATYREPYVVVNRLKDEKQTGWAYSAGLTELYAGPRTNRPDPNAVEAFIRHLQGLDVRDITSGAKAWRYVEKHFEAVPAPLADAAFILLEEFLRRMEIEGELWKLTEGKLPFTEADAQAVYKGRFDYRKYPITDSLSTNGFRLAWGEGMFFPVVNWDRLRDFFGPRVSPAMQRYIIQRTEEYKHPIYDDGGIVVPLEAVAEMAVWWEKFNRRYPYFVRRGEAQESEAWLRLVLLNGVDNTPVFPAESEEVSQAYRSAWEYVLQRHPKTELARRIKEMADLCAAEGWKRTEKVNALRARNLQEYNER
jgi:hypothetical protein